MLRDLITGSQKDIKQGLCADFIFDNRFISSEDSGEKSVLHLALENSFLVMYDADLKAIYELPAPSIAVNEYVVHCENYIHDFGDSEF